MSPGDIPVPDTDTSAADVKPPRKLVRNATDLTRPDARQPPTPQTTTTTVHDIIESMKQRQAVQEASMQKADEAFKAFATAIDARIEGIANANAAAIASVRDVTAGLQTRVEALASQISEVQSGLQLILERLPAQ